MSTKKPFDADATINLDAVDGIETIPDEEPAPQRVSRATPPPLPPSAFTPSAPPVHPSMPPPQPSTSPVRLLIYAVLAMVLGGAALVGVMKAIAPKPQAVAPAPSAAPIGSAAATINLPPVEFDDQK
jgi:hypothetical protein